MKLGSTLVVVVYGDVKERFAIFLRSKIRYCAALVKLETR